MRRLKRLMIYIIIFAFSWWLLQKYLVPSWKNIFSPKPVTIDETPILIKDIRSIGQLITYSAYDEVVADTIIATRGSNFVNTFNRLSPFPVLPSADKQLVLIGRGKVLA